MVGYPAVMDTEGMTWRIMIRRKYKFDIFLNCNSRFKGRNVRKVYFVVDIPLSMNAGLLLSFKLSWLILICLKGS